jgi:hypothetical protein
LIRIIIFQINQLKLYSLLNIFLDFGLTIFEKNKYKNSFVFIGFVTNLNTAAIAYSVVVPIIIGFNSNLSSIHLSISIISPFIIIPSLYGTHGSFNCKKFELVGTFSDWT